MYSLDGVASADNLSGGSHSAPSTPQLPKSEYHMRTTLSRFVFTTFPASPFASQDCPVHRRTSYNLPSVIAPMPVVKSTTNSVPETGLLGGRVNLLPQDLVSADVLRECSPSRDAELKAVDRQREALGRPSSKFVLFSVMSVANDFTRS